jgi:photosynthetic reaction center cytochrome c subunit
MRKQRIVYGFGCLLLGVASGFLIANWMATGASADVQRMEIGVPATGSLQLSSDKILGHSVGGATEGLMSVLRWGGGDMIDVPRSPSFDSPPVHSAGSPPVQEDRPVEQTQKNIQVLKGLPSSQLFMTMNFMRASLGVNCAYCHVYEGEDKWEWEKDDKPQKRTARRMIQMVFDINKANFKGEKRVTCYTCHRGQTEPAALPPLPQIAPEGGAGGNRDEKPAAAALPTVEQVLNRYVEALGGKAAYEKLKTRVMKGSQVRFDGTALPLEVYQSSPNRLVSIVTTANGSVSSGFNGMTGWIKNPRGQRDMSGSQLAQMKRAAEFYGDLKLRELYPNTVLVGTEKVSEREAYVIQSPVEDKRTERLYFDMQTGLLVRILGLTETIIGAIPDQTDFSDYREVDGVKLPFTVQVSYVDPWIGWTRKFTEIKHNLPVDEQRFSKPGIDQK